MRKIINGQRFDTEKSILIGEYSFSNPGDFNYMEEGLYVTPKSRQYFISGSGGANTRYSQTVSQNTWTGGDKIQPLSREDAFKWAQQYLDEDEIEKHFADLIEDA